MDLFEEIAKAKQDFPKVNNFTREVKAYKFNFYQIFSVTFFAVIFFVGILFGNLFATCDTASFYYSDTCLVTEFNFSLMLVIWVLGALVSLLIFAIGHIIALLSSINEKIGKFKL